MKMIRVGMMGLSLGLLLLGTDAVAKDREAGKQKQENKASQQQQEGRKDRQQVETQTIRGKVAGVTAVGEAVIDPATNTAVVVSADYLTVLGTPVGRRGAKSAKSQAHKSGNQAKAADSDRDNLYLVAITPETTVREGRSGARASAHDADKSKQDQAASKAAFEKLQIGDQVVVQVAGADQLRQKGGNDVRSQYRPDANPKSKKHGKHRIVIGEATSVTILPAPKASGRNQKTDESRNR